MGVHEFRRLINPIIADKRNMALEDASQKQYLQSNEVVPFVKKIGMDLDAFGKLIVIPGNGLKKERLRTLLPYVPEEDFTPVLIRILADTRKNTLHKGRFSKYLNIGEVHCYLKTIGELIPEKKEKAPN